MTQLGSLYILLYKYCRYICTPGLGGSFGRVFGIHSNGKEAVKGMALCIEEWCISKSGGLLGNLIDM